MFLPSFLQFTQNLISIIVSVITHASINIINAAQTKPKTPGIKIRLKNSSNILFNLLDLITKHDNSFKTTIIFYIEIFKYILSSRLLLKMFHDLNMDWRYALLQ